MKRSMGCWYASHASYKSLAEASPSKISPSSAVVAEAATQSARMSSNEMASRAFSHAFATSSLTAPPPSTSRSALAYAALEATSRRHARAQLSLYATSVDVCARSEACFSVGAFGAAASAILSAPRNCSNPRFVCIAAAAPPSKTRDVFEASKAWRRRSSTARAQWRRRIKRKPSTSATATSPASRRAQRCSSPVRTSNVGDRLPRRSSKRSCAACSSFSIGSLQARPAPSVERKRGPDDLAPRPEERRSSATAWT
mmetsp:Transcript_29000/g.97810  ORF Transcript_29000/g.97810 Transcript_29000/m.97810 type:complete len:256 (-) Transcript_29000:1634-2401(-)